MRIYYIGQEPREDARLAGVELAYGQAVDVPPALADVLLDETCYSASLDEPVVYEVEPAQEVEMGHYGPEADWYKPDPGDELQALDGLGPKTARVLIDRGVSYLTDLASLSDDAAVQLSQEMPGVTMTTMRRWVSEAKELAEVSYGNKSE